MYGHCNITTFAQSQIVCHSAKNRTFSPGIAVTSPLRSFLFSPVVNNKVSLCLQIKPFRVSMGVEQCFSCLCIVNKYINKYINKCNFLVSVKTIRGKTDILVTFNLNSLQTSDLRIVNVDLMVVVRCSKRKCRARKARRGGRREAPTTITLKIYNMLNSSGDNNGGRMITSLKVGVRRTKWQKLIVPTSVIQEVIDSQSRVLPIRIACVNCSKGIRPVAMRKARRKKNRKSRRDVGAAAERTRRPRRKSSAARRRERRLQNQRAKTGVKVRKKKQPFLVIYTRRVEQIGVRTMSELRTRQRRHVVQQSNVATSSPATVCRKKTMYVSFRQLELDNVIVWPLGYRASFCDNVASDAGAERLPHRHHKSKLTMHNAHRRPIENAEHTSCCRPTKTAPLSVTYLLDKNTVIETSIPGLITTECGCVV